MYSALRKIFRRVLNEVSILKMRVFNPRFNTGSKCRVSWSVRIKGNGSVVIGNNCIIRQGAILSPSACGSIGSITIGSDCSIGVYNFLDGSGILQIGDWVHIGPHVSIFTSNFRYQDLNIPIRRQGLEYKPVVIEENVWIGTHASILAGVTIGTGAVIAAGAVVTRDVEPNSVMAGIPAREIKNRASRVEEEFQHRGDVQILG